MEHHLEARLWNDVFRMAQDLLQIPRGSIRATCLIETITAAFQMDEIIYQLREHSSGLNCGRWDCESCPIPPEQPAPSSSQQSLCFGSDRRKDHAKNEY